MKRLTLIATLIAALFGASAQAAETLRVAHDQWIGYAGVFIAQDKGYFEDAGLNVETVSFSGPGDTLPPLVGGHVDIALTTGQNLAMIGAKSDVGIRAVYFLDTSDGADAVVAAEGIETPADLEGKRIAVTRNEVNHLLLMVALDSAGLGEEDIQLVDMSADDAGAAFLAGKVDAAVTWEPWVTKAKSGGGNVVFTSADAPNIIMDAISVTQDTLENRPEALTAFMGAVDRGVAFLESNPDESRAIIAKWLDVSAADVDGMLAGDKIYDLADNERLLGTSDAPGPIYGSMDTVIDFLIDQALIDSRPDPASLIDPSLVR